MKEEFKRRRPAHLLGARKDPSIIGSFHSLLMYLSEREKKYVSFIICYICLGVGGWLLTILVAQCNVYLETRRRGENIYKYN